jgi:tRNA A-37 threonylcarbamoyl transferase component Bud32
MDSLDSKLIRLRRSRLGPYYFSRKNKVFRSWLGDRVVVVKEFGEARAESASSEFSILERCIGAGVPVPSPIELLSHAIVMEHIDGPTVSAMIDSAEDAKGATASVGIEKCHQVADALGNWLAGFHRMSDSRLARGDANMRNFILAGPVLYGVDFEESSECDVLVDLGQMCSSILSMRPMFVREKFELVRRMSSRYFQATGLDRSDDLPRATAEALRFYAQFRDDREKMLSWAERIESRGLEPE